MNGKFTALTTPAGGGNPGSVEYLDGESLKFTESDKKFLTGFKMGRYSRDLRPIASPGEDGQGTKDFGERDQSFSVEVIYIHSSEDNVLKAIQADLLILGRPTSFDTIPLTGCILEDSKFEQARTGQLANAGGGGGSGGAVQKTVYCKGWLIFKSVRPSG
jgi:hypothetical protein